MNIPYTALCPECRKNGKQERLNRNLDEVSKVFCEAGHEFSGPEIEEYLQSNESESMPPQEPTPTAPIKPVKKDHIPENELVDREDEPRNEFELQPLPSVSEDVLRMVERVHRDAEKVSGTTPASAPIDVAVAEPPKPEPVQVVAKKIDGGALQLTVIIPDPHASFLAGEAEVRGLTPEEHFQQIVSFGLDSRWFY